MLRVKGYTDFTIDAGGDIQVGSRERVIGIRNPFDSMSVVKKVQLKDRGIATSGTYIRGDHIYNPHDENFQTEFVSFSVIGPNVYDADRFATAAFAMGRKGLYFIENLPGFEAYAINQMGIGVYTSGFSNYVV